MVWKPERGGASRLRLPVFSNLDMENLTCDLHSFHGPMVLFKISTPIWIFMVIYHV